MLSHRSKIVWLGLFALLAACANQSAAQAQVTLRYKFKEGEKLHYNLEQKMKMEMNVAGQNVDMNMNQTVDMTWNVLAVDKDGKAKMTQSIDRIKFVMEGPMGKAEFDSKDSKEPEGAIGQAIGPIFKALAAAEFSLTMDAQGKISDVKLPQKLQDALEKLPQGGAGQMFSEDTFKQMANQGGLVLPAEAVSKMKSWDQNVDANVGFGKMKVANKYTYVGPTNRNGREVEQIAMKPKLTMEPSDNAAFTMKLKDQEAKGSAYFDKEAGRLVETNLTQTMDMEVSANGMNINQKLEQTVTMKLVDKTK
ncbi:MAG TPA: DUF6263 family protein [Gemmataceae bacterium]|nr:DUF6263 family protein [Gemmataceae bacterium]